LFQAFPLERGERKGERRNRREERGTPEISNFVKVFINVLGRGWSIIGLLYKSTK